MTTQRIFTYGGLTIGVTCSDAADLLWLEEFLTPAFTVVEADAPDCSMALVVDDDAYDEIMRRGSHAGAAQLDCFALDNDIIRLPVWGSADADRILFDAPHRVFYFVSPDGTGVRLLTQSRNRAVRIALMRVVREFAMAAAHAAERLVIHGAAVAVGDNGIIIAGPKGAGKTSLLIHLLRHRGAQFVSNDRVVVDLEPPEPTLRGMPTVVTIRNHTVELFPRLRARLLERGYDHRFALLEGTAHTGGSAQLPPPRPVNLTPAQFSELLGVQRTDQRTLRTFLFPRVTGAQAGIEVRELPGQAASARLSEALFGRATAYTTSPVFALKRHRGQADAARLARLCTELARRVRCFDCRLGRQAYLSELPIAAVFRQ